MFRRDWRSKFGLLAGPDPRRFCGERDDFVVTLQSRRSRMSVRWRRCFRAMRRIATNVAKLPELSRHQN
jgi:hypothetical protein